MLKNSLAQPPVRSLEMRLPRPGWRFYFMAPAHGRLFPNGPLNT